MGEVMPFKPIVEMFELDWWEGPFPLNV